jgi:hypothetical protein
VTGYNGVDPHPDRVKDWPGNVAARIRDGDDRGVLNLGMRMPVGGIGIDVDAYDGKRGLEAIADFEARLGPLPPTYRITARPYESGSGIRLYRVPDDWRGRTILKLGGEYGPVEIIQRHHRLAAVPPSHHRTGARYRIYDERSGLEVPGGVVPPMHDWPKMPDAWLDGLRTDPTKAAGGEATDEQVEQFAAEHTRNAQPWHLAESVVPKVRNANGDGTRNPTRDALCEAARDARVGWCSSATAVAEIEAAARDSYTQRGSTFDVEDFARSVKYAVSEANAEDVAALEARYAKTLIDLTDVPTRQEIEHRHVQLLAEHDMGHRGRSRA